MGNTEEQSKSQASKPNAIPFEAAEAVCPSCSRRNDSSGLFCEECGTALKQPAHCPKCGATARLRADICEICGTWLLKWQCKFCYAYVGENETFCGECGNPAEGINCPRCGQLSIFDFCKTCSIPLSIQAKEMARETAEDPAFKEMVSLFEQLSGADASSHLPEKMSAQLAIDPATCAAAQDDQVLQLKAYRDTLQATPAIKPKSKHKALFSSNQKERISQLNEEVFQEEERRRIAEERRRQEEERKRKEAEERRRMEEERRRVEEARRREEERRLQEQFNEAMRKLSGKTFSTQQEARRYFMSMIAGLPEHITRKITGSGLAWRCNAYDCVHNTPGDCADPSRGGVWLIR